MLASLAWAEAFNRRLGKLADMLVENGVDAVRLSSSIAENRADSLPRLLCSCTRPSSARRSSYTSSSSPRDGLLLYRQPLTFEGKVPNPVSIPPFAEAATSKLLPYKLDSDVDVNSDEHRNSLEINIEAVADLVEAFGDGKGTETAKKREKGAMRVFGKGMRGRQPRTATTRASTNWMEGGSCPIWELPR